MKAFKIAFVIAGLTVGSAFASDFSFTGNLKDGDEVQPFFFTVTEPTTITLQTFSYDGGTNAAGTKIPSGGFDPTISLFDAISGRLIAFNDDNSASAGLWDSFLQMDLNAGNYIATLTQFASFAAGSLLSDGFSGSGGTVGSLHWAVDILNASSASVAVPYISPIPEPESYAMFLAGLGLLGWRMRGFAVLQSNRQGSLET
jgi:hypothetical protein